MTTERHSGSSERREHSTRQRAAAPLGSLLVRSCFVAALTSVPLAFAACGPAARSVGDSCPDLPLYRYVFDESTKQWTRVRVETGDASTPLTDAEVTAIAKAEQSDPNCITGGGAANSISPRGDGSTALPADASRD